MRAISDGLRLRVHEARQAGESTAEVVERFAISPVFVRRLEQRFSIIGSPASPSGAAVPLGEAGQNDTLR